MSRGGRAKRTKQKCNATLHFSPRNHVISQRSSTFEIVCGPLVLTLHCRCQHEKYIYCTNLVPTLINFNICRFIGKTVQVEFFRRLNGCIASPVLIAHLTKLWDKLHWPPDTRKRDYQTFPRAITSKITYKLIHLDVRVCHVFCTGHNLEGLDIGEKGDTITILFWSEDYSQLCDFASFSQIGHCERMQKKPRHKTHLVFQNH